MAFFCFVDPFDTTIAGEVIPELADKKEESIEVEEKEEEPVEIQRPSTPPSPASEIKPETKKQPPPPPKKVDEIARKYGRARPKKALARQLTDEDFDPRS